MFDPAVGTHPSSLALIKEPDIHGSSSLRIQSASEDRILSFFLNLSTEERTCRFAGAVSDAAIRVWRQSIDRDYYVCVGQERAHQPIGLVELFGSRATGWQRPELALSIRQASDSFRLRLHLLEIGLSVANEKGAVDVFMCLEGADNARQRALASHYGGIEDASGIVVIPCGFVSVNGVSSWYGAL